MKEIQHFEIDGMRVEIATMMTSKSIKWFRRLQKILLPSLGKLISAYDGKVESNVLSDALETLANDVSEEQYLEWVKDLLADVLVEGRKVNIEIDFHGRLLTMHKILIKVLEVNFADFLSVLKGGSALGFLKTTPK